MIVTRKWRNLWVESADTTATFKKKKIRSNKIIHRAGGELFFMRKCKSSEPEGYQVLVLSGRCASYQGLMKNPYTVSVPIDTGEEHG